MESVDEEMTGEVTRKKVGIRLPRQASGQSVEERWSLELEALAQIADIVEIPADTPAEFAAGAPDVDAIITSWGMRINKQVIDALEVGLVPQLVRTGSEVGVDEGGCSTTRARARCACRSSWIRPAVSTPATPAIAANEGSRCGRSHHRTVEGVEMRTFGDEQVAPQRSE